MPQSWSRFWSRKQLEEAQGTVTVRRQEDWVAVSADMDWLSSDVASFFAPVTYLEGGPNSSRVEVVLTAFCDAVVTATQDGALEISSAPGAGCQAVTSWRSQKDADVWWLSCHRKESRLERPEAGRKEDGRGPVLRLIQGDNEERIVAAVRSFIEKQNAAPA